MKKIIISSAAIFGFTNLNAQAHFFEKCISRALDIPLQTVISHVETNKDLKLLKNDEAADYYIQDCRIRFGNQPDINESELESRFYKSIGASQFYEEKDLSKYAADTIKKYKCLKDRYGMRYDIEPEFLTKEEFEAKYPDKSPEEVSFEQNFWNTNYNRRQAIQKVFSECISKEDAEFDE